MPGSVLGLGVRLSATDAMSGPVGAASRSLGLLEEKALSAREALANLQVRAGGVATAIGAGLTGAVGVSIAQAAELEDIMFLVQQKTGFADETIREMSDDFLRLSASLPLSAQELARVGVIAGQLGIATKEGIEALAFTAAQLARTSDLTEETAAAGLARLSKLFNLPIEQADRLSSSLVRLANASTAETSTIVDITQRFAGLARVLGMSVAQSSAFSATLVDAGISSEVAGSSMLEIMGEMTSRTRAFGKQLGVSEKQFKTMLSEDAAGTMVRFFESFRGMDKFKVKQRLDALGLSGIRVSTAVFGLASQTEALRTNLAASVQAFDEGTDLSRAFESQTRSLSARIDTFAGSLKNAAISIGDTLIPAVKFIVDLGTDLLAVFLELPRPVKLAIGVVLALAGGFFLLTGAGLLISGTMSLLAISMTQYAAMAGITITSNSVLGITWQVMTAQLRGLVTSLIAGTTALWAQVVALRAQFVAWLQNIGGVTGLIAAAWAWITTAFASVAASFAAAGGLAGVGAAAIAAGAAIWTALAPFLPIILLIVAAVALLFLAWKVLKPVISAVFGAIANLVKPVIAAIGWVADAVGEVVGAFASIFDPIVELIESMGTLKVVFLLAFAPILGAVLPVVLALKQLALVFRFVKAIVAGAVAAIRPIFDGLAEIFDTIMEAVQSVKQAFTDLFGAAQGGGGAFEGIGKAIGFIVTITNPWILALRGVVFVLKILGNWIAGAIKGFALLLAPIIEAVRTIMGAIQGVVDRVKAAFTSTGREGGGFFKLIQSVASFAFRFLSPLGLAIRAIGFAFKFVAGFIEGAAEVVMEILEPVFDIVATIKQAFSDLGAALGGLFGEGAGEGLFSGLLSGIQAVGKFFFKFLSPLGLVLRALGVAFRVLGFVVRAVIDTVKGIFQGVFAAFGGMIDQFKAAWESLKAAVGTIIEPLVEAWNAIKAAFGGGAEGGFSFLEVLKAIGGFVIQVFLLPLRALAFSLKALFTVVGVAIRVILFPITLLARAIGFVVGGVVGFFRALFQGARAVLGVVFAPFIAAFKAIGAVVSWLKGLFFGSSFLHLVEGLSPVLGIFKVFEAAIAALAAPFKLVAKVVEFVIGLVKKLLGVFETLFDAVKTVGSVLLAPVNAIGSALGGLVSVGKSVVGGIVDVASSVVGTVGGAISSGISAIGDFFGLQEGGIVTRPTLAMVGEAGPEAVIPLPRTAAPPVAAAAPAAPAAARERDGGVEVARIVIPITLECDGHVLARIVKEFGAEELLRGFAEPRLRFAGGCP